MLPITALLGIGEKILDKVIPDPIQRAEAARKLLEVQQSGQLAEIQASMSVIVAEAKSEHWLTATWRPVTMLTFVAIVANNYIIYPYLSLLWDSAPVLSVPADLWDLLKIGLGGYVVGRSAEKVVREYKK